MTISYDFMAFSGRLSESSWTLGMKAIQGEVPLDIVIPSLQTSSDYDEKDIIGVLTKEGISRESSDVMELYRYLRQLNPKSNQAFGYNEVAIRNIHTRLNLLKVDEELRVQITYTERKENYIAASYNIKLLGIFQITTADLPVPPAPDITENIDIDVSEADTQDIPEQQEKPIIPKDFPQTDQEIPVYKTTNTLEKLITFTRTLQSELKEITENLALMTERVRLLEEERQRYRGQEDLLQEILKRLNHLESFERRIDFLEDDRHQLDDLKQTLIAYFRTSNRQTRALLNEVSDETDDTNSISETSQ
ncbi:hypothetical protein J4G08_06760 [Candidatus Poribacteria bacterium]|nr:hypothetical protein [Candidatus Poribacteria bacterium]